MPHRASEQVSETDNRDLLRAPLFDLSESNRMAVVAEKVNWHPADRLVAACIVQEGLEIGLIERRVLIVIPMPIHVSEPIRH